MQNALIPVTSDNAPVYFSQNGLDPIIEKIRKEVTNFVADITTDKGRKEISSMARKVASSKVALDDLGKDLVSGYKSKAGVVDAERKRMRDTLDALRDEVRKPLTDWEEKEEKRVDAMKKLIERIEALGNCVVDGLKVAAAVCSADLSKIVIDESYREFEEVALQAKQLASEKLTVAIAKEQKEENDRQELERLRKESLEREQRDRDEANRKAGEEAERKASQAAIDKANRDKEAAEQATRDAEAKGKRDAEEAASRERNRIAAEKKGEEDAAAAREKNKKHRAKINNEALDAMTKEGYDTEKDEPIVIPKAVAKSILTAIALGKIPHVKISY